MSVEILSTVAQLYEKTFENACNMQVNDFEGHSRSSELPQLDRPNITFSTQLTAGDPPGFPRLERCL